MGDVRKDCTLPLLCHNASSSKTGFWNASNAIGSQVAPGGILLHLPSPLHPTSDPRSMPSMPSLGALVSEETPNAMLEAVGLDGEDEEVELYEQPPPGPSLGERHSVDDSAVSSLSKEQKEEAARCLRLTTMFKFCSDESIARVVDHMRREEFSEGEVRAHD